MVVGQVRGSGRHRCPLTWANVSVGGDPPDRVGWRHLAVRPDHPDSELARQPDPGSNVFRGCRIPEPPSRGGTSSLELSGIRKIAAETGP